MVLKLVNPFVLPTVLWCAQNSHSTLIGYRLVDVCEKIEPCYLTRLYLVDDCSARAAV